MHCLRDHESETLLEAVAQPLLQPLDAIARCAGVDDDVVTRELDVEPLRVVGPRVERAARHEVEPCVMPVARQQAGLDRALMKREAEMRTAILDRERASLVPDDHDREGADLAEQPALALELGERPGGRERGNRVGHGTMLRPRCEYVK